MNLELSITKETEHLASLTKLNNAKRLIADAVKDLEPNETRRIISWFRYQWQISGEKKKTYKSKKHRPPLNETILTVMSDGLVHSIKDLYPHVKTFTSRASCGACVQYLINNGILKRVGRGRYQLI